MGKSSRDFGGQRVILSGSRGSEPSKRGGVAILAPCDKLPAPLFEPPQPHSQYDLV